MGERSESYIQHRGIREGEGLPNSFESILKNWNGAQEMDVILLKDGNIAVFHEHTFRMPIEDAETLTLEDVERLQIPTTNPDSTGRSVPLLREFIGLASDADTALRIELRGSNQTKVVELATATVNQLAQIEQEGGLRGNAQFLQNKVRIATFSVSALRTIQAEARAEQLPLSTGLFWPSSEEWAQVVPLFDSSEMENVPSIHSLEWNERGIAVAAHNHFQEIEFQPQVINKSLVESAHARGLEIGASLVHDEETAKQLVELGVDHILTEQ